MKLDRQLFASSYYFSLITLSCFFTLTNEIQLLKVGENYLLACCNVSRMSYSKFHYFKQTKAELSAKIDVHMENWTSVIQLNRTDGLQGRLLPLNPETGFELYQWYVVCAVGHEDEGYETCILVRPCDCPCIGTAYRTVTLRSIKSVGKNGIEKVFTNVSLTSYGAPLPISEKLTFELWNLDVCESESESYEPEYECGSPSIARYSVNEFQGNQTRTYNIETSVPGKYKLFVKITSTNEPYPYMIDNSQEMPFEESYINVKPFVWNLTQNDVLMTKIEHVPYVNSSLINEFIEEMNSITLCTRVNTSPRASMNGFINHMVLIIFVYVLIH